ncbi:Glycosyl transferase, group 1 (fragment) [Thiocapsa sp. KS1]
MALVTQNSSGHGTDENLLPPEEWVTTLLAPAYRVPGARMTWSPRFHAILRECCKDRSADLIHDHGLWLSTNRAAASAASANEIPLIISTRGMLEPWALSHRSWKKRVAWLLYQQRILRAACVLHATAQHEVDSLRRLGFCQPIAMIPNGVDLGHSNAEAMTNTSARIALFVGRIHPVKGLVELVEAWRIARPYGWKVIIAGPDEGGHRALVEERICASGLSADFDFVGTVEGKEKDALFRSADLLVLPSFTENFGLAVAEALSYAVPVITTHGTPWADLQTYDCGWWVAVGVEPLAEAILEATSLDNEARRAMGARGRVYVQRYAWGGIARQMAALYRWVLGQGSKPDCVQE